MIYLEIWSEAWLDIALWHTCTSLEALAYSRVVEVSTCGKARPHAGQRSEMIYLEIWSEAWILRCGIPVPVWRPWLTAEYK
jgi:hypothetical protein